MSLERYNLLRYEIECNEKGLVYNCVEEIKNVTKLDGQIVLTNITKRNLSLQQMQSILSSYKEFVPPLPVVEPTFKEV